MSQKGKLILGVLFVLLLSFLGFYYALEIMLPFMWVMLGLIAVIFIYWIYFERRNLSSFFKMKTTKHGLNMGALILICFVFLFSLNFLVVKKNFTFDYSMAGQYTLSPLSLKIIKDADAPINFKFFYKAGSENVENNRKAFSQIMRLYSEASNHVNIEFVEMNSHPKLTLDFGATKPSGEAFVEYKDQKNRIEAQFLGAQGQKYNEQDVTNAIIKVTRKNKKTVYFVTGHSERDFQNEKLDIGVSTFKQMLEKNSYIVKPLSFSEQGEVPLDASVLVILAPQTPFLSFEYKALMNYIEKGGALLLALDDKKTAGLADLVALLGLKLDEHYVFNILNTNMGPIVNSAQPTVAVDFSGDSPITKVLSSNMSMLFNKPNSWSEVKPGEFVKTEYLVRSPKASVALINLDSEKYEGEPRSFNLVAQSAGQVKKDGPIFHIVLSADADVFNNVNIGQNANRDFALNSIAYLAQEQDLISIAPKDVGVTRLLMNPVETTQYFKLTILAFILPLPFLFLVFSIFIWIRRKNA